MSIVTYEKSDCQRPTYSARSILSLLQHWQANTCTLDTGSVLLPPARNDPAIDQRRSQQAVAEGHRSTFPHPRRLVLLPPMHIFAEHPARPGDLLLGNARIIPA